MIEVVQYEPSHAYNILDRNVREQDLWLSQFSEWEKCAKGWRDAGPAYTLIIDGEIVACAGIVLMEWNRGEAWMLLSSLFYKYPKTTIKYLKVYLNKIIEKHTLKRLQALVHPDNVKAKNFIKYLGFKNEGTMRGYGPNNEDLLMFARII